MLIAASIHYFFMPHGLIEGGLLGVGLMLSYLFPVSAGKAVMLMSVPIYFFAWFHNKSFVLYNVTGVIMTACLIDLMEFIPLSVKLPPLYSSIVGGLVIGTGMGLLIRQSITTDGLDLLAQLVGRFLKVHVGVVIFVFDVLVIGAGFVIMTKQQFLLSLIAISGVGFMTVLLANRNANTHWKTIP